MEYYIAFDRGSFRSYDRFVKISNSLIHESLAKSNNLKAVCSFTGQFENESELKDALIKISPKLSIYREFSLAIVWKRKYKGQEYIRSNFVPYSEDMKFFNFEFLAKAISNNVYNPFLEVFLNYYRNCKYLNNEICDLYSSVMEYKPMYIIEDAVRAFLNKELYGKNGLEFSKLYKMAMLVSRMLGSARDSSMIKPKEPLVQSYSGTNYSEVEMFELEWLEDRARLREKNNGYY